MLEGVYIAAGEPDYPEPVCPICGGTTCVGASYERIRQGQRNRWTQTNYTADGFSHRRQRNHRTGEEAHTYTWSGADFGWKASGTSTKARQDSNGDWFTVDEFVDEVDIAADKLRRAFGKSTEQMEAFRRAVEEATGRKTVWYTFDGSSMSSFNNMPVWDEKIGRDGKPKKYKGPEHKGSKRKKSHRGMGW